MTSASTDTASFADVVNDLLTGQYNNPMRVLAFNNAAAP
jgi:hypothetical protein